MQTTENIITQTKKWITDVVIGCNFCPFAGPVVKLQKVHYQVETSAAMETCLESFVDELQRLDEDETIETSLLIFPSQFADFEQYLTLVELAEELLEENDYDGIYQVASFHPQYRFAGAPDADAANYTNRSPYPMLHVLREASIDKALEHYDNPEAIPERNIAFAREKGVEYMKLLMEG
jgi:uncharacterized protein